MAYIAPTTTIDLVFKQGGVEKGRVTVNPDGTYSLATLAAGAYEVDIEPPIAGFTRTIDQVQLTDVSGSTPPANVLPITGVDIDPNHDASLNIYYRKTAVVGNQAPICGSVTLANDRTVDPANMLIFLPTVAFFNYTDVDNDALAIIKITQVPAKGIFRQVAASIAVGQELVVSNGLFTGGEVTYAGAFDQYAAFNDVIKFKVKCGSLWSTNEGTLTIQNSAMTSIRLSAYAGVTATQIKARAVIPDQEDMSLEPTAVVCNNISLGAIQSGLGGVSDDVLTNLATYCTEWSWFGPKEWNLIAGVFVDSVKSDLVFNDFAGYNDVAAGPNLASYSDTVTFSEGDTACTVYFNIDFEEIDWLDRADGAIDAVSVEMTLDGQTFVANKDLLSASYLSGLQQIAYSFDATGWDYLDKNVACRFYFSKLTDGTYVEVCDVPNLSDADVLITAREKANLINFSLGPNASILGWSLMWGPEDQALSGVTQNDNIFGAIDTLQLSASGVAKNPPFTTGELAITECTLELSVKLNNGAWVPIGSITMLENEGTQQGYNLPWQVTYGDEVRAQAELYSNAAPISEASTVVNDRSTDTDTMTVVQEILPTDFLFTDPDNDDLDAIYIYGYTGNGVLKYDGIIVAPADIPLTLLVINGSFERGPLTYEHDIDINEAYDYTIDFYVRTLNQFDTANPNFG